MLSGGTDEIMVRRVLLHEIFISRRPVYSVEEMAGFLSEYIVWAAFLLSVGWGATNQSHTVWARTETLDSNRKVRLQWTPRTRNGEIEFFFVAPSTGWIGVGFSPNGGMKGADIVIGGVKDGSTYFSVCLLSSLM